jgi:hypothetical protein
LDQPGYGCKTFIEVSKFLSKANSYHGIFPHWLNGATGIAFLFRGMMAPMW